MGTCSAESEVGHPHRRDRAATPGSLVLGDQRFEGFAEASAAVVSFLKSKLPLGFWAVTRYDGDNQVYLEVRDSAYGLTAGGSHRWKESFCANMVAGTTPRVAPDAMAIPQYSGAGVAQQLRIGAYVGVPIVDDEGELFGTLCGLDPERQSDALEEHALLLDLLGTLLSSVLAFDLDRAHHQRALERAELESASDELTGLLNRRGWERYVEIEEARLRRFGDPVAVVIIDLDGLKQVNDTRGHDAGDELLRRAADVIRQSIRDSDIAARLGGDEFGIIARDVTASQCDAFVGRILHGFDEAGVSASIGYAPCTVADGLSAASHAADEAMYAQKRRWRAGRLSADSSSLDRPNGDDRRPSGISGSGAWRLRS